MSPRSTTTSSTAWCRCSGSDHGTQTRAGLSCTHVLARKHPAATRARNTTRGCSTSASHALLEVILGRGDPAREENTVSDEQVIPETRGVTAELLAAVDLGSEIEGMAGRHLRMRLFTFEPGAVFGPIHDHIGRPGIVYILQGTITDHRDGVATAYGPGVGWPEDRNTKHWLENRGTSTAVEISVDLVTQD